MNVTEDGALGSHVRPLTHTLLFHFSQNEFLHRNMRMTSFASCWVPGTVGVW